MGLKERIKRLEAIIGTTSRNLYPGNEDGFLTALGVNEKDFEAPGGGGYDFIAALNATAADSWEGVQV